MHWYGLLKRATIHALGLLGFTEETLVDEYPCFQPGHQLDRATTLRLGDDGVNQGAGGVF
jgi:hypothetical protein